MHGKCKSNVSLPSSKKEKVKVNNYRFSPKNVIVIVFVVTISGKGGEASRVYLLCVTIHVVILIYTDICLFTIPA